MSQSLLGQHSCCANVFSAGARGGARGAGGGGEARGGAVAEPEVGRAGSLPWDTAAGTALHTTPYF